MLEIWAYYWDMESNRRRQAFLGSGKGQKVWYQALQRVQHVKSFFYGLNGRLVERKMGCFVGPKSVILKWKKNHPIVWKNPPHGSNLAKKTHCYKEKSTCQQLH